MSEIRAEEASDCPTPAPREGELTHEALDAHFVCHLVTGGVQGSKKTLSPVPAPVVPR